MKHVGRIAAAADADHQVARLDEIAQLFGHGNVVPFVVAPGHQRRDVVDQGNGAEAMPAGNVGAFVEVAGEVAGNRAAAAVAADVDARAALPGVEEQVDGGSDLFGGQSSDQARG